MKRPPAVHVFQPPHSEGQLLGPEPAELGLKKYKRAINMIVSGAIIGLIAFMVISNYYHARGPARVADCMGRLRVLGNALSMYEADNTFMPPGPVWRWGVSDYVDAVGGTTRDVDDYARSMQPRGFSSPMRCLGNETTIPISYLYLDPLEVAQVWQAQEAAELPVLVDEVHHRSVVALRSDWSQRSLTRQAWFHERREVLQIARRPDWQDTFAYYHTTFPVANPSQ
jgi:hypothetical protein